MSTNREADAALDADEDGDKPVASVQRAALVLDAFLHADGPLTLADLSAATGLYKSTIGRILRTLEMDDYVVRTRHSEFHIGPSLLRLASRYQEAAQPGELVLPVLADLVRLTGESASYVVPLEQDRVILYRTHSAHALRDHGLAGDVVPLERGAAGHVFSAYRNNQVSARASQVRERMMAISTSEIETGMTGMACPVFDRTRECVSVVALSGPSTRFTPEAMSTWTGKLLRAAQTLTAGLGGNARLFSGVLALIH